MTFLDMRHNGFVRSQASATVIRQPPARAALRATTDLDAAILGALVYLDDMQIRNHPGRSDNIVDGSDVEEDCIAREIINLPPFISPKLDIPRFSEYKVSKQCGEWPSHIHILPKRHNFRRARIKVSDSNPFVTAFIVHPLFLIEEVGCSVLKPMLSLAMRSIVGYKRGNAYNFWPPAPVGESPFSVVRPPNIPVGPVEKLARALLNHRWNLPLRRLKARMGPELITWIETCMGTEANGPGAYTFFNIPNDADDTAVIVAAQGLYAKHFAEAPAPDLAALNLVTRFRDINRTKEDGKDAWKGKNSGAYLTWLRDEGAPLFDYSSGGCVPLGVNNVDAVVNTNCLYSLSLNDMNDAPGYEDCEALVAKAIYGHHWPEAGLYYPQNMIFPYCASRAFRDGGARSDSMSNAMKRLLADLLDEQTGGRTQDGLPICTFSGGKDPSNDLSTALGCITLTNIGEGLAAEAGLLDRYRTALEQSIRYLLSRRRKHKVCNSEAFGDNTSRPQAFAWEEGLLFSDVFNDIAHWRSQPFTVAIILEALVKYRLAYDTHDMPFHASQRLRLTRTAQGFALGPC